MLTTSMIAELLGPYGVPPSIDLSEKILAYVDLLLKWNRKIALTTVTDPIEIVKFHFGESLFAFSTGACGKSRLADVGTGAGFPGLALAVADSNFQIDLIESNLKKCAFLSEVIRRLQITNASVFPVRMESLTVSHTEYDFISARALGQFDDLLHWASGRLEAKGQIMLWLGDEDVRKLSAHLDWDWKHPILIPGSTRRYILQGSPKRPAS